MSQSNSPLYDSRAVGELRESDVATLIEGKIGPRTASIVKAPSLFSAEHPDGRYELGELLGEGTNGRVYSAFDRDLRREVALKIVMVSDPKQRERFAREARVTAGLTHPNVPQLYEVGESDGALYLSMQRARGISLASLIRAAVENGTAQVMPIDDLVEMMLKLCDAVAYAHARGVMHCDIKPHNVMIGSHGEVTLVDWGAAHSAIDAGGVQHRVGTPAYMAPEQALGEAPNPSSDIHALGATLFHALLLRKPLERTSSDEFWARKQRGELDPPSADELLRVPRPVLAIALKAMSREASERYATATAFAQALRDFRAGRAAWAAPIVNEHFSDDDFSQRWQCIPRGAFAGDGERLVSRAQHGSLIAYKQRLPPSVALEFDAEILNGQRPGDISVVWTDDDLLEPEPHWPKRGTCLSLQIAAFDNLRVGIYRDFVQCLSGHSRSIEIGRRYTVRAEIQERRLRLLLDGELIAEYEELLPLASGHVAVFCYGEGKAIYAIRLYEQGVPERVSPTAVGDAFFGLGDYEHAANQYARVEKLLPRSELADEARFKRGLCLLRKDDAAGAKRAWVGLTSGAWSTRATLHSIDAAFNAGRHEEVVAELARLLASEPGARASVMDRWSQYVNALCESDHRPLALYADFREQYFACHVESAASAAALEVARGNWQVVLERYADEHLHFVEACNALGEYQRIVEKYPRIDWIRDLALLRLNQYEHPVLGEWSRLLAAPLRGDVEAALRSDSSAEAFLSVGRFEKVLSIAHVQPVDFAAALRGMNRVEEAAKRGDGRALSELDADERALSDALVLRERVYLMHHLAIRAFIAHDYALFERHLRAARQLPCSASWDDVWVHRYFLLPTLEERLGRRGSIEANARHVIANCRQHWYAKGFYLARFVLGEIGLDEFEAQPCRLHLRSRALVARALRAEFERDERSRAAIYQRYLEQARNERTPDSARLDPLFDRWARFRSQ